MQRYKKFIKKGINEPLSNVEFHTFAPIKRISMLNKKIIPKSDTHIAIHVIDSAQKNMLEYSLLHKHNADEINLIISDNGKLKYEIQLDDEKYKVTSPATVFIPKGVRHKAKLISGEGTFV